MDRVQNGTEGPSNSFITGTQLDADFQQDLQEELIGIIVDAGLTPTLGLTTQLLAAIELKVATGGAGSYVSIQVFESSGTWVKPAGINLIKVLTVGGGAGGGGASTTYNSSGGGGAAWSELTIDATALVSETVTIGAAGTVGSGSNSAGGTGGTSSFGSLTSGAGGVGGKSDIATDTTIIGSTGGNASGLGDISEHGGATAPSKYGSAGGVSFLGGGGWGAIDSSGGTGRTRGSGGGGCTDASTDRSGGLGKSGIVVVWEYK